MHKLWKLPTDYPTGYMPPKFEAGPWEKPHLELGNMPEKETYLEDQLPDEIRITCTLDRLPVNPEAQAHLILGGISKPLRSLYPAPKRFCAGVRLNPTGRYSIKTEHGTLFFKEPDTPFGRLEFEFDKQFLTPPTPLLEQCRHPTEKAVPLPYAGFFPPSAAIEGIQQSYVVLHDKGAETGLKIRDRKSWQQLGYQIPHHTPSLAEDIRHGNLSLSLSGEFSWTYRSIGYQSHEESIDLIFIK